MHTDKQGLLLLQSRLMAPILILRYHIIFRVLPDGTKQLPVL